MPQQPTGVFSGQMNNTNQPFQSNVFANSGNFAGRPYQGPTYR
jgi:hypothetical protein